LQVVAEEVRAFAERVVAALAVLLPGQLLSFREPSALSSALVVPAAPPQAQNVVRKAETRLRLLFQQSVAVAVVLIPHKQAVETAGQAVVAEPTPLLEAFREVRQPKGKEATEETDSLQTPQMSERAVAVAVSHLREAMLP
jgi:hypothetical protein